MKLLYFCGLRVSFSFDGLLLLSQDLDELEIFFLLRFEDGAVVLGCLKVSYLLLALALQSQMFALADSDIVFQVQDSLFEISHFIVK